MENTGFLDRLNECIRDSSPSQTAIADYCDVSKQAVNNWKRTGQLSRDNLKKLSEITGYRYLWLLSGEGPKLFTDAEENNREYQTAEEGGSYGVAGKNGINSPATQNLLNSLTYALANRHMDEESVELLAKFVASLGTRTR